jgi:DnaJ domain
VPPIVLLFGLLYFEFRVSRTSPDVSLSQQEALELSHIEEKLRAVRRVLSEIYEKGSHLNTNLDGSYHRGSKLGMRLNAELEKLVPYEEQLQKHAQEIQLRPLYTLDEWTHVTSLQFAFRFTAAAYVTIALFLYLLNPAPINDFSKLVGQYVLIRISHVHDALYGSALVSALAGALLLPLLYKTSRLWLERSTEAVRLRLKEFTTEEDGEHGEPVQNEDYDHGRESGDDEWDEEQPKGSKPKNKNSARSMDARLGEGWYETLRVSPTASAEEINAGWRERMKKNHPDRVAELDPEFQALAEERAKRLNAARAEGLSQN